VTGANARIPIITIAHRFRSVIAKPSLSSLDYFDIRIPVLSEPELSIFFKLNSDDMNGSKPFASEESNR
jgi:hypothetical protein